MADCTGVISQLFIYPVKSCAGIEVSESRITPTGLEFDREWMIVDQHGQFLTQRQIPHMVWITPSLTQDALVLNAPQQPEISIPFGQRGKTLTVNVWRDTLTADDMGDAVAAWLDRYLAVPGKQFRLVRFSSNARRMSATEWTNGQEFPNMFSDGFAALIVTQLALDAFNARLTDAGHEPVSMLRFRPNIVIEGLEAHTEDDLQHLRIHTAAGMVELSMAKPCPRCPIPDIDPFTAQSTPSVSQTLQTYRALPRMQGAVCFGMNAIVKSGMGDTLHSGQPFEADYAI
jgi:uncharacterized protein YcbX